MRPLLATALIAMLLTGPAGTEPPGAEQAPGVDAPEVILDGSEIDPTLIPTFADLEGDGTLDLLVGTTNRLLIYPNTGTNDRPEYAEPRWLDESVSSALIPDG